MFDYALWMDVSEKVECYLLVMLSFAKSYIALCRYLISCVGVMRCFTR